ncbi:DUF983 domain-containing protein [Altererythrobacter sp. JGD-16]|uniref:DUF983 domain-containing protein n=2 Tax=Altererythrobacter lutimaris TaxID=2743979 RepID=A0A850HAK4_9SPHN|nr:DUF983 domain-containing protein [Altererythrobacter lutimaris]
MCPRCGVRTVFDAPAQVADKCTSCGLDFSELEGGGRFVGLLTMIIALGLIGIAWWIDSAFRPSLVLQMIVWLPVTVAVVIGSLRLFKIVFLYACYERRNGASEDFASNSEAIDDKES